MSKFENLLAGGDLRSIGKNSSVVLEVKTQDDFDELFAFLLHAEGLLVMRAADAIEKITTSNTKFLSKHKNTILELCDTARNKELKWHLALLLPRLPLTKNEVDKACLLLTNWARDKSNSRIVRVNALQGLFELLNKGSSLTPEFESILLELEKEKIPSINARIKKLKNLFLNQD